MLLLMETAMPIVRKWIKGPMWLHFLVGVSYQQRCKISFLCSLLSVLRAGYIHKLSAKKPVSCLLKFYYWCLFHLCIDAGTACYSSFISLCWTSRFEIFLSSFTTFDQFQSRDEWNRSYHMNLGFVSISSTSWCCIFLLGGMFAGGTVPALAQLASSSYRAAVHSSQPPQAQKDNKMQKSTTSPL